MTKKNKEVRKMKSVFNFAKRAFLVTKTNTNKHILFFTTRRKYKQIKYTLFNRAKEDKLKRLAQLESKDQKQFWKCVRNILSQIKSQNNSITPDA